MAHHENIWTPLISNTRTNPVNLSKVSSSWRWKCLQPVGQPELGTGLPWRKVKWASSRICLGCPRCMWSVVSCWRISLREATRSPVAVGLSYTREACMWQKASKEKVRGLWIATGSHLEAWIQWAYWMESVGGEVCGIPHGSLPHGLLSLQQSLQMFITELVAE